jgi:hypothetical protein
MLTKINIIKVISVLLILISGFIYIQYTPAQKDQSVTSFWSAYNNKSTYIVDHHYWQKFLHKFVHRDQSGIHLVDYNKAVNDSLLLQQYLVQLKEIDPRELNKKEQKAYWINIYNALTIRLILNNFPTDSIVNLGSTLFGFGPWDDTIITLANQKLTLNDIEHRILRPIWQDPRIHFAVNCASIGCPNLQKEVFTAENMDDLLEEATEEFVNHQRGASISNNTLTLSSIFDWYGSDFGASISDQRSWISEYAQDDIADALNNPKNNIIYQYNWQLNVLK